MTRPLDPQDLRWQCDPSELDFETTAEVDPISGIVGQDSAVDALRFGLETDAPGQNVFVRGLYGTGRMTLIGQVLEDIDPGFRRRKDRCFVHNFTQPHRPRLIELPSGRSSCFRRDVQRFAEFIAEELGSALRADPIKARRESIESQESEELKAITQPFEAALREAGLGLVTVQAGVATQAAIFPMIEGKPVAPEEFAHLHATGKVDEEQFQAFQKGRESFQKQLFEVGEKVRDIRAKHATAVNELMADSARSILREAAASILHDHPSPAVEVFVSEVIDDVVDVRLHQPADSLPPATELYGVNVVLRGCPEDRCAVVIENTPTLTNLVGAIEREWGPRGPEPSDFRNIRAGALLRADGGYLVLDARDLLLEPGAWKVLVRTLRSGLLEFAPPELSWPFGSQGLKPEPIPINVRVILVGDAGIYHALDGYDPDFAHLFKVLSDFDSTIPRDQESINGYARALARIFFEEKLPPLHRDAVAALAEFGARIAGRGKKLSTRLGRVADIAREGAYLCRKERREVVTAEDVREAIRRTKCRADLPYRRFREYLRDGTIRVATRGEAVGQINGLAVISAGPVKYGFPARITASIGAGSAGLINIEGAAALSGTIHTKGFHILSGLLRNLLQTDHPLAFSASIAFEQSYGGIDGDSASGAETCCLLSALTNIPIKQSFAVTGAIDQLGALQAIGGVNEKIEGFFDTCNDLGLTGEQGVIIPSANANELMLRADVVAACAEGKFHVYAVDRIHDALEILTGVPAGDREGDGDYPEGTLLAQAVDKAWEYWVRSVQSPAQWLAESETEDEGEEGAAPGGAAAKGPKES